MNEATSRPLFIYGNSTFSASSFDSILAEHTALFAAHTHILLQVDHPVLFNAALILSHKTHAHLFVCPSYYSKEEVDAIIAKFPITLLLTNRGFDLQVKTIVQPSLSKNPADSGALYVFTSATTGPAKITEHSWEKIQHSAKQAKKLSHNTWLMSYALYTYAGLQVFFSAYLNEVIIYYPAPLDPDFISHLIHNKVSVISATPTYWKMLISRWSLNLPRLDLVQATLGGEVVNQDVLDLILNFFHPKQLTHIYASSEAGTAIVVSDSLAGFPLAYLNKRSDVEVRIQENRLQIKSRYGMNSYLNAKPPLTEDGWIDTGDLVEIRGERIYFLGRGDEVINVGGLKVNPEEVEGALCSLEEITDACVYGKKNPITGNIVAAQIVLKAGYELNLDSIYERLRGLIASFKIPRLIKQVPYLEVSSNGKKLRPK